MAAAAEAFSAAHPNHDGSKFPLMNPDQLLKLVGQLESKLNNESVQKSNMQEEINALREENMRLQEESHTAAQQLRRFTEWFFQTMENNPDQH